MLKFVPSHLSGKDIIYAPNSNESCVSLFPCKLAQGGQARHFPTERLPFKGRQRAICNCWPSLHSCYLNTEVGFNFDCKIVSCLRKLKVVSQTTGKFRQMKHRLTLCAGTCPQASRWQTAFLQRLTKGGEHWKSSFGQSKVCNLLPITFNKSKPSLSKEGKQCSNQENLELSFT